MSLIKALTASGGARLSHCNVVGNNSVFRHRNRDDTSIQNYQEKAREARCLSLGDCFIVAEVITSTFYRTTLSFSLSGWHIYTI